MNIPISNIVSASDIQKNYRKIFDRAKRTKEPIIVFRGTEPEVAVVDIGSLTYLQKKTGEAEMADALRAIKLMREEKRRGKLKVLPIDGLIKLVGQWNQCAQSKFFTPLTFSAR